jgi:hypothetical protein
MPARQTAGLPAKLGSEATSWTASYARTASDDYRNSRYRHPRAAEQRVAFARCRPFSPFAPSKDAGRSSLSTKLEASASPRVCDLGYPGVRVALRCMSLEGQPEKNRRRRSTAVRPPTTEVFTDVHPVARRRGTALADFAKRLEIKDSLSRSRDGGRGPSFSENWYRTPYIELDCQDKRP